MLPKSERTALRVLVTGATGFFGKAIVGTLQDAGHEVIRAARKATGNVEPLDVTSAKSCEALLSRYPRLDAVVNCAAIAHANHDAFSTEQYRITNGVGARNMIDAAVRHGAARFIQISTVSVYGEFDLPSPVLETSPLNPLGAYGVSKKLAEELCLEKVNQINLVIFRMATMYSSEWLFNVRKKVTPPKIGRHFRLTLDGASRRYSLCSNKNGAGAVLAVVEDRLAAGIYNVADFYDYSLREILEAVQALEGKKPFLNIPRGVASLLLGLLVWLAPTARSRQAAYSRRWKFCKDNLYSTERLKAAGLACRPDLLEMKEN